MFCKHVLKKILTFFVWFGVEFFAHSILKKKKIMDEFVICEATNGFLGLSNYSFNPVFFNNKKKLFL